MTIREAIQDYRHFIESMTGDNSDDTLTSDLAVYNKLKTARAVALKSLLDKNEFLSEEHYQVLTCVSLEEEDIVQCPFVPPSGCTWLVSTCDIPKTITLKSVSTHLGKQFSYVRWDKIKEKVGGRIGSAAKDKFYTTRMVGEKLFLYIYNDEFIKSILITGIFEDPIEASVFCKGGDNVCSPMESSFHTAQSIFDLVSKNAWDVMLRARSSAKLKALNNDSPIDQTTTLPNSK